MAKTKHIIKATCYDSKGKLLSFAYNSYTKSHPIQSYFALKVNQPHKIYLHAEIAAILKARDKRIYSIHIYRRNKQNDLANAKPCPICMEAIKAYGIKKVFYSDSHGNIETIII